MLIAALQVCGQAERGEAGRVPRAVVAPAFILAIQLLQNCIQSRSHSTYVSDSVSHVHTGLAHGPSLSTVGALGSCLAPHMNMLHSIVPPALGGSRRCYVNA
mmetsp:Transcript_19591/g.59306  ORF Transcript_19591/g.59306 Transcript_19591/m.59306 type:complete len:102 (+) Transcript_19591:477-782(+)|eukprot:scaffold82154_cov33-Tisochrysis_lutea.AAC.1